MLSEVHQEMVRQAIAAGVSAEALASLVTVLLSLQAEGQ